MNYDLLYGERTVRSVTNLTRQDAREFLEVTAEIPVEVDVETFPLREANDALRRLKEGQIEGAAVLIP
jgi:propanol-preferring alcohol dehydrogenase